MQPSHLVEPAVQIIQELFGPRTAEQYRQFYSDKEDRVILESLDELLHEVLGPREAQERLTAMQKDKSRTP